MPRLVGKEVTPGWGLGSYPTLWGLSWHLDPSDWLLEPWKDETRTWSAGMEAPLVWRGPVPAYPARAEQRKQLSGLSGSCCSTAGRDPAF